MKRAALGILAFACLLTAAVGCSSVPRTTDGQSVPERIWGVYRVYPEKIAPPCAAPKGYEAFYISHYGRHGSRRLLYDSQYLFVYTALCTAAADGKLTSVGQKAHKELLGLYPQFEGQAGELTPPGVAQHRAIAQRMAQNYPSVFREGTVVRASTSPTSRTQESMDAFCAQLQACFPTLRIELSPDAALNPYSDASGIPTQYDLRVKSPQAEWRGRFDALCRQTLDTQRFAERIFTDASYAASLGDLTTLVRNIFYMAIHFRGCGVDTDWLRLFTLDELHALAQADAYTFYMEKGPARQTSDRTWALSAHILDKVLKDAQSGIADGTAADLRFGHDGCIMALLTLMEADGWTLIAETEQQAAAAWDVSQIPMASNLQWIFYRPVSGDGELLVRVLLNETPLRLPVTDQSGLCSWSELQQYLEGRCRAAFAILNLQ